MSTTFAIDNEENRIEDVTEHPEILDMLQKGKFVGFNTIHHSLVPSDHEILAQGRQG